MRIAFPLFPLKFGSQFQRVCEKISNPFPYFHLLYCTPLIILPTLVIISDQIESCVMMHQSTFVRIGEILFKNDSIFLLQIVQTERIDGEEDIERRTVGSAELPDWIGAGRIHGDQDELSQSSHTRRVSAD